MDLWIRTQNRNELIKVNEIRILEQYAHNTKQYIYTSIYVNNGYEIAQYKTKKEH